MSSLHGLKHQDPLSLEAFFLDELSREIGYETDEDALIEELPSEREYVRKTDLYYEETIPLMTDEQFRTNFRVNRDTLSTIVEILGEREGNPSGAGMVPAPREKQLLLTLFYLGSTLSFRKVAAQFEMNMSTAWEFVDEVIELLSGLKDVFIRLPAGHQMLSTVQSFEQICGVKGVLGVVSDCHIPIRKPVKDPDTFANWKGFFSFHMMTVCDAANRFTDVSVGWPGAMHEAEVFDSGTLSAQLASEAVRDTYVPGDCFLVGGAALPLRSWLMTPFRDGRAPLADAKKEHYNRLLATTADVGRRATSVLKARFRRLTFVDTKSVKKAVMIACASCVLHNMCLSLEDEWLEELVEEEPDPSAREADPGPGGSLAPVAAHRRRSRLVSELWGTQVG